jgi:hypothetical protein
LAEAKEAAICERESKLFAKPVVDWLVVDWLVVGKCVPMDSELSSDEEIQSNPIPPLVRGPGNVDRIRSLAPSELQKYIDEPPGEGKSVVYAFANVVNGKAYAGKHRHGKSGRSVAATRLADFLDPKDTDHSFKANAVRKHGRGAFVPFIIWHGETFYEDTKEVFWISPDGLHTRKSKGGWGYNDLEGGGSGGVLSEEGIQKMKTTKRQPSAVAVASAKSKALVEYQIANGLPTIADHGNRWYASATPEQLAERRRKHAETTSTPEWKSKASDRGKAQEKRRVDAGMKSFADLAQEWRKNATLEQEAARVNSVRTSMATDASKRKRSKIAKVQFENEEANDPGGRSRRAKKQMECEAAAGMKSLAERGNEWRKNVTPDQLAAMQQKRKETTYKARAEKLAALPPFEREKQEREYAREDRKTAKKQADLAFLKSIPGHENDTSKDLPSARKAGLFAPPSPHPLPQPTLTMPLKLKGHWFWASDTDSD